MKKRKMLTIPVDLETYKRFRILAAKQDKALAQWSREILLKTAEIEEGKIQNNE